MEQAATHDLELERHIVAAHITRCADWLNPDDIHDHRLKRIAQAFTLKLARQDFRAEYRQTAPVERYDDIRYDHGLEQALHDLGDPNAEATCWYAAGLAQTHRCIPLDHERRRIEHLADARRAIAELDTTRRNILQSLT